MADYRASEADIKELADAHNRVIGVRRELQAAEAKTVEIRQRLQSVEMQLANAIRQVCRSQTD